MKLHDPSIAVRGPTRTHLGAECPSLLSAKSWAYLGRHVDRAFLRPHNWRPTLRVAVRRVALEMQMLGADPRSVRRALERRSDRPMPAPLSRTGSMHSMPARVTSPERASCATHLRETHAAA